MLKIRDDISSLPASEMADIIRRLPAWRRDVVMRYRFERSRRESALAFALLQEMLLTHYGIADDIEFAIGPHGKPALPNHPDIHFNLSHCPKAVACAVSDSPVGVDIESLGRYKDTLARHTLSPDEMQSLTASVYPDRPHLTPAAVTDLTFTILWTKKEALLKLIGTGITDNLPDILPAYRQKIAFDTYVNLSRGYVCTTCRHARPADCRETLEFVDSHS